MELRRRAGWGLKPKPRPCQSLIKVNHIFIPLTLSCTLPSFLPLGLPSSLGLSSLNWPPRESIRGESTKFESLPDRGATSKGPQLLSWIVELWDWTNGDVRPSSEWQGHGHPILISTIIEDGISQNNFQRSQDSSLPPPSSLIPFIHLLQ